MKILPKKISAKIPKIKESKGTRDPTVWVKLFLTGSAFTWYIIEFDGEDLCFGYVVGLENELGYFSMRELVSIKNQFGLGVERDLYFKPCKLSEIK